MDQSESECGWNGALIEHTRDLFVRMAERFDLEYEWDETAPVEIACRFLVQKGLDFELWFSLSGDEFICSGERWYATIFSADDPDKWELFARLVEGLITGEARVKLYRALGWSKPYWTVVQLRVDGRWNNVSTGAGCAILPIVRPTILRNGYAPIVGFFRPALGSAMVLAAIFGLFYWMLN